MRKEQQILDDMVDVQKEKLLKVAHTVLPYLTFEDLLQPHDFPQLDADPEFRYEEGVLHGLQSALAALRALS